ncbi:beta-1 adrenergic receptor-like [Dendronephthya gigantea]|uniref:beta-1 adrenergic receptor-like n=1 Tax=Dendronephthya gigantea TaxID=151771 RepID=UPI001068FD83|nr:beta-1 adrenergic receptor-like [Dendronephthya gigantea]
MASSIKEFEKQVFLAERILLISIAILTVLGNTLVLILTWREKCLHEPSKYFVAFLAAADLLVGIFVAPLSYYAVLLYDQPASVLLSVHLCRFMTWIDTFALTTSIYTLTVISFDRYLKISKPFRYKTLMTTSTTKKLLFIIVFVSAVIATYSATPCSGSHGLLATGSGVCSSSDEGEVFETFLSISAFFLPDTIILVMYGLIFIVAHRRNKKLVNGGLSQTMINQKKRTTLRRDLKVIRMLLIVAGVFILCWGPWIAWTRLWYYYYDFINWESDSESYWRRVDILSLVVTTLPLFNSLCNPIIYACLDQKYTEAFKRLVKKITFRKKSFGRQPQPIQLVPLKNRLHN